jgi:signal-transduction protein with cAMP-binding, CBS, and nucleotidyltransferase domain
MTAIPQPFNEMQLEIIKLFARDMSTEDMKSIKRLIVRYFAQKAIQNANKVWDDNGWTKEDETRLLNIHERTPYMPK